MTTNATNLRVDGARLLGDLASLARIGAAASGGVNRPAYSDADLEAREAVRGIMRDIGLDVRVDAAGNTFGARAGTRHDAAPLIIGSHTDTVPEGGRFDGALGVLAAIEVARTLAERGVALAHPLEVVDFQNEEGGLIGSKIVAGRFTPDALDLVATSGFTLREGIARLGGDPALLDRVVRAPGSIAGYLELHIEQGRTLERAGAHIGVVEGLVGIRYWEVVFDGAAAHAGTTPMADRRDALLAAARFVDAVHAVVTAMPGRHVGTVGRLSVHPGGANVVPGRVALTLELRDLDARTIHTLFDRVAAAGQRIATATRTTFAAVPTLTAAPSPMHPDARRAIAHAATTLRLRTLDLPSGAGHDAQNMAALGPAGMIFVPSVDGISHSPAERTEDHDVVNGANALLGALMRLDESA